MTVTLDIILSGIPDPTGATDGYVITVDSDDYILAAPTGGSANRELLTADRTYYVRIDGSDSNNGLANTSGGAFLTSQKAYDVICSILDLGGKTVTIKCGAGTYSTGATANLNLAQPWTGGGSIIWEGDTATPSNCLLQTTSGNIISCITTLPGSFTIQGFKISTSGGLGISHLGVGTIYFANMDFGGMSTGYHTYAGGPAAYIIVKTNYTISGAAGRHWATNDGGFINCVGKTITLTGTPAIGIFAEAQLLGGMEVYSNTFTGSATGVRYSAVLNGAIKVAGAGANYFPGNTAGSTATGGQYA